MITKSNLLIFASKIALLALLTFVPYYLLRIYSLTEEAGRFLDPLLNTSAESEAWLKQRPREILEYGTTSFLKADWSAVWRFVANQPESESTDPKLILDLCLNRDYETSAIVSACDILREVNNQVDPQAVFESSWDEPKAIETPWLIKKRQNMQWLVVRIGGENGEPIAGFLEIGLQKGRLTRWLDVLGLNGLATAIQGESAIEKQSVALAKLWAKVIERTEQSRLSRLKKNLAKKELRSRDETELYEHFTKALSGYFRRPVSIIQFAEEARTIEAVYGSFDQDRIKWLGQRLSQQEPRNLLEGPCTYQRYFEVHEPEYKNKHEYLTIFPLIVREAEIEFIVLGDFQESLASSDRKALSDLAATLNASVARRRASGLFQLGESWLLGPQVTRQRLSELARRVKAETSADIVVLYEFDHGRVQLPPVIEGDLLDPFYNRDKPFVIEDSNPVLRLKQQNEIIFVSDHQVNSLQDPNNAGLNQHGDPGFSQREKIVSSIAVPLRVNRGVVGVMWVNYRTPQIFDDTTKQRNRELFRHLPEQILQHQTIEAGRELLNYALRESLRADWTHHTVQDLLVSAGHAEGAKEAIHIGDSDGALARIDSLIELLVSASADTREKLSNIQETPIVSNLELQLYEHVAKLRATYGMPRAFNPDQLDVIPEALSGEIFLIVCEAITNAVKWGRAETVSVQADSSRGRVHVIVKDNGIGFTPARESFGNGLRGMRARAVMLGGKLSIGSKPGEGTGVILDIPLDLEGVT